MKKLVTGECRDENIFALVDPASFVEIEFEAEVVKALTCLQPDYWCGVFAGKFELDGERRRADLALIHKTFSHWFVVEVEVAGHSLEHHILPQVRCLRYGEPDGTCVASLCNAFPQFDAGQAGRILRDVPRYVAVIGNRFDQQWSHALHALDTQYLTLSVYRSSQGKTAHEIDGQLTARRESLGFARYSETYKSLRISRRCGLPVGQVQIIDQFGISGTWTVREHSGALWISKDTGTPLLEHECYVQIIRTSDGLVSLRPSAP